MPTSQQGREYGGGFVPFEVVETFLYTACAGHLLRNDWLIAESVQTRDLELLIILLQNYYAPPTSFMEKLTFKTFYIRINDIGLMSDRTREDFELLMDYWSTFSLMGQKFVDWVLTCRQGDDGNDLWFCRNAKEKERLCYLIHSMVRSSKLFNRKLMESEQVGIVHVPMDTMPGDEICILRSCDLPMVLRREGSEYRVIGGCYCYPIMHGQAMKEHLTGQMKLDDFTLI